ncbi:SYF2-domain-containing protein [Gonapodya prolifera JEL478]|uniref:Pre-mRNA-splicing factor SYF2 n=1 Tax=Gonapodya prolifera (strain JEL478) TaxID=1344416 RepID=A0A139AEH2_GONPJ|nr:SYF2-domain-containing protein [Gonapodya prolifera JEL478]|eukprot:KXS15158.1 SYF2-domain-containing protein [Gonapodya prolifera JEL478]
MSAPPPPAEPDSHDDSRADAPPPDQTHVSPAESDSDMASDSELTDLRSRLKKFKSLKSKMAVSQSLNRRAVLAEDAAKKQDPREEARRERKRKEAEELASEKAAESAGLDPERLRDLQYTAEDVERWDRKVKRKKEGEDKAFESFNSAATKSYRRLVSQLKPDLGAYAESRAKAEARGVEFYRGADETDAMGETTTGEGVDRMVRGVEESQDRRSKFSRRRAHRDDDDVTYINERNARFNKKISRAYDKYTQEIKANFERGTAL